MVFNSAKKRILNCFLPVNDVLLTTDSVADLKYPFNQVYVFVYVIL